jgi:hypothetical protein
MNVISRYFLWICSNPWDILGFWSNPGIFIGFCEIHGFIGNIQGFFFILGKIEFVWVNPGLK